MTVKRLGVLGAGIMGQRIADAAAATGRFAVVAVADADAAAASRLAGRHGARVFSGIDDLLHSPEFDAVYIALPHDLHLRACLAAADAGVHVLIDKPLCTSVAEADAILGAARRAGTVWGVGFSYRFRSDWRRAQQLVAAGVIGEPYFLTDVIVEAYASTPAWYWDPRSGGGALQLQTHHTFDRHRWILDRLPVRIACTLSPWRDRADRSAVLCADYGAGVVASTSISFGLTYASGEPRTLFVVQGENGMIQLDDSRTLRLITASGTSAEQHGDDDWVDREISEFADALDGAGDGFPSLADGLSALRQTTAAATAARTGTWVAADA